MSVRTAPPERLALSEPYHPREVRFAGRWDEGEWRIKVYTIAHHARAMPGAAEIGAARAAARPLLAGASDDHHGVGYLILHAGREGLFLLVDWWFGENMVAHQVLFAPPAAPLEFRPFGPGGPACVWELEVMHAERTAWVDEVLRGGGGLDAYLARTFEGWV